MHCRLMPVKAMMRLFSIHATPVTGIDLSDDHKNERILKVLWLWTVMVDYFTGFLLKHIGDREQLLRFLS